VSRFYPMEVFVHVNTFTWRFNSPSQENNPTRSHVMIVVSKSMNEEQTKTELIIIFRSKSCCCTLTAL
jgi:hypothetical protein